MHAHGKKYRAAAKGRDEASVYQPKQALEMVKQAAFAKFDETVEIAVRLGVDPRHADQIVRGTVVLPAGTGKSVRVLVIDDSHTIRRSAELYLTEAGCEVLLAEDGFEALVKITDHQPQVIFVDVMMPRLDGYQTCALIKRHPKFAATPVIMLSSKDGLFDRARGRLAGSDLYITKPFTSDALLKAVFDHVPARV